MTRTRKKLVLKPWAKVALALAGMAILAAVSYLITSALTSHDRNDVVDQLKSLEPSHSTVTDTPSSPGLPTNDWGENNPNSIKVCAIVNGVYLNSVAEAKSLDERLYGYYQGVKQESPVLASFINYLHEDPTDLKFYNDQLAKDLPAECEEQTP